MTAIAPIPRIPTTPKPPAVPSLWNLIFDEIEDRITKLNSGKQESGDYLVATDLSAYLSQSQGDLRYALIGSGAGAAGMVQIYDAVPVDPPLYQLYMVVPPPDVSPPVVTAFVATSGVPSPVPITFTAVDNTLVTGYWIGETAVSPALNDAGWTTPAPTSYATATVGKTTLYARVRDAAGNISAAVSQPVTVQQAPKYWSTTDRNLALTTIDASRKILTARNLGSGRGELGISTGKRQFEVLIGGNNICMIGVGTSAASLAVYPGADAFGWGYFGVTGNKANSGSITSYGAPWDDGDTIGVVLDFANGSLRFYKNGVVQGAAYTGLAGTLYPMFGSATDTTEKMVAIMQDPLVYPVAGATLWA